MERWKNKMSHSNIICIIRNSEGNLLGTGFIIALTTQSSIVLTAGHVLRVSTSKDAISDEKQIRALFNAGRGWTEKLACQEILAYSLPTLENGYLDFALLKFARSSQVKDAGSCRGITNQKISGLRVTSCGTSSHWKGPNPLMDYSGEIEGVYRPDASNPQSYCYTLKGHFPAQPGYSGSPLMIGQNKRKKPEIIAVFTGRGEPEQGAIGQQAEELRLYATPIARIVKAVPEWDSIIGSKTVSSRLAKLFNLPLSAKLPERYRTMLALHKAGEESFEKDIALIVEGNMTTAKENVNSILNECGDWLEIETPVTCEGIVILSLRDAQANDWPTALQTDTNEAQRRQLRLVVECKTGLPTVPWDDLRLENSHGILVALKKGSPAEKHAAGLAVFEDEDRDRTAAKVQQLLEDTLLDINVFYGINLLPGLYASTASRQEFERQKGAFLEQIGFGDKHTIAAAARSKSSGPIDPLEYHKMWEAFIFGWLFPGTVESSFLPSLTAIDLNDHVRLEESIKYAFNNHPTLGGQMGKSKISRALKRFSEDHADWGSGRLFLAVLIKKPEERQTRKDLMSIFGMGSFHLKSIAFFTLDELVRFLRLFATYVQILPIDLPTQPNELP